MQSCCGLSLGIKTTYLAFTGQHAAADHFHSDFAIKFALLGSVDHSHSAATDHVKQQIVA